MDEWRSLSQRADVPLFHELGVLWLHADGEPFYEANAKMLQQFELPFSRWSAAEVRRRFPVVQINDNERGFFEPLGGGLMARQAVQKLAQELEEKGVTFIKSSAEPIHIDQAENGALNAVQLDDGSVIQAEQFVFACGPWLDKVCPDAMQDRLFVTRQEVLYFDAHQDVTGDLPVWADLPFYGLPSVAGLGFKVANDTHGQHVVMNEIDRRPSALAEQQAREFLARRFPAIADAALSGVRVCQYENSSNGDFVLDNHPGFDNVYIAGCGSGHGFKHGPAIGEHLAGRVMGTENAIDRFSLLSKQTTQKREVQ
jgi:glycine/D-amino acid oxidase-like deaminating enzyme